MKSFDDNKVISTLEIDINQTEQENKNIICLCDCVILAFESHQFTS